MKKEFIPALAQDEHKQEQAGSHQGMSEELQNAIQHLIYRLREGGPM